MNRCWPLSTERPAAGSSNEYARPPRCGFFSRTRTLRPFAASAAAHDSPAKPAPRTRTSGRSVPDAIAIQPAAQRQRKLPVRGQRGLLVQHAEYLLADLVEQALVDVGHHLGGRERRA